MRYWESNKNPRARVRKTRKTTGHSIASGGSLKNSPFLREFYQHQAEISGGLQKLFFFIILATLLYVFVLGNGGAIHILTLRSKKAHVENNIAELSKRSSLIAHEIDMLKSDPFFMEKLGRERYGLIRPGDKVYKLVPGNNKSRSLDK